jgi:glycosyltransferase involved in cell wall biosynthesis
VSDAGSPLVSVIIPAWNAETTLSETLRSVSAQTYPNIEIIIVDDGSTDRTPQITEEFCSREPRARLVRKENGGLASARNRGIEESRGRWIAPIDADDLWHPTRIEKMVAAALSANPVPGFVYCWFRHIDREGAVRGSGPRWRVQGPAFDRLAYLNVVGNGSGLLLSKEAIVEAGGYDSKLRAENAQGAEDMLVQDRIASNNPIALVPEFLVGWRQTGENMSADAEQMHRSCRLVYERLRRDGIPAPARAERWMIASSAFDVAEHHGASGRFGACLRWLARSLWLDPLRSGLKLGYRLTRSVRRRLGPTPATRPARRDFFDVEPTDFSIGDPHEIGWFKRLLERLDERRLEQLAEEDCQGESMPSARPK